MSSWLSPLNSLQSLDDAELSATHTQLQSHLKRIRYAIPIVVLLVMTGFILHMKNTVQSVSSEEFGSAFEKRSKILLPKLQDAFLDVGKEVAPDVGESLANEVDELMANFSGKMNTEMNKMKETLPKQMEGLLLREMKAARERQIETLNAEFPALKNDPKRIEALMRSFEMAFARWAQKMLVANFNKHLRDLEVIKRTLNGFVAKQNDAFAKNEKTAAAAGAGIRAAGNRVQPEQLLALWLEIMEESIKGDGPIDLLADPTKEKKGK